MTQQRYCLSASADGGLHMDEVPAAVACDMNMSCCLSEEFDEQQAKAAQQSYRAAATLLVDLT